MTVWRGGNRITLLENGADFFPALSGAIEEADSEVYLESYIFATDRVGEEIKDALRRAALRGVRVHVLVDGFGSREFPDAWRWEFEESGVQLLFYRPEVTPWPPRSNRLRRLHRKLAAIDGDLAFVGGINIIADEDTPHQIPPRYDYAVRLEGPLVADVRGAMYQLWRLSAWAQFRRQLAPRRKPGAHPWPVGRTRAAFLVRDNLRHRQDIELAYLEAITGARKEIVIANAYFLPGRRFLQALRQAARRGVRVVLLLQGRVEYLLVDLASHALFGTLLRAGVEIHLYRAGFLHAKVAVVDGHWATIGSSNIDPFSLLLAREANIVVADTRFSAELRESLGNALANHGERILPETLERKPWWRKGTEWAAYGLVRTLTGLAAYGGDY